MNKTKYYITDGEGNMREVSKAVLDELYDFAPSRTQELTKELLAIGPYATRHIAGKATGLSGRELDDIIEKLQAGYRVVAFNIR